MNYIVVIILSLTSGLAHGAKQNSHAKAKPSAPRNLTSFPDNFLFGVATSAYQIEGGWNLDGKGESIWDRAVHTPGTIDDGSTGDIACDSYHQYEEDIRILKKIKVHCYRFSIAWTRIFPYGTTNVLNQEGVDYYNKLIDGLVANGIKPMITLFHWDTPQSLQDLGGWTNKKMIGWFVDYADKMFEFFGDRVTTWATMNEPANYCGLGYTMGMAPFIDSPGIGLYLCAHNIIRAHAKTYRMYQKKYKNVQNGKIGIVLDSAWNEPENPKLKEDRDAAEVALDFHFGWFAWPIYKTGDYPLSMRQRIDQRSREQGFRTSRLPHFTPNEKLEILNSFDYLGLNHYMTMMTKFDNQSATAIPTMINDGNLNVYLDPSWTKTQSAIMTVRPKSFTKLLLWVGKVLGNDVEIAVTENGYNGFPNGTLNDQDRVDYLNSYLQALLDAMNKGANVLAYTWWSVIDNFEWVNGYTSKFGLYQVDFQSTNRTRTPRKSAMVFQNVAVTKKIDRNFDPEDFAH